MYLKMTPIMKNIPQRYKIIPRLSLLHVDYKRLLGFVTSLKTGHKFNEFPYSRPGSVCTWEPHFKPLLPNLCTCSSPYLHTNFQNQGYFAYCMYQIIQVPCCVSFTFFTFKNTFYTLFVIVTSSGFTPVIFPNLHSLRLKTQIFSLPKTPVPPPPTQLVLKERGWRTHHREKWCSSAEAITDLPD